MSKTKFNFHQSITEINKNGFAVHSLSQSVISAEDGVYEWHCEVVNEEGTNLTEHGAMPLDALNAAINAIHALALASPVEDDCDLV